MRTIGEILQTLGTTRDQGLSSAASAESKQRFGVNSLTPVPREPVWKKLLAKFDEPIIKILLVAALLSLLVDLFKVNATAASIGLIGGVIAIGAAYLFQQRRWVPSLLCAGAFAVFFIGLAAGHVLVEGLAVMIAVILATGVAFYSEYKSDREFEILNTHKESLRAKVIRDGKPSELHLEDILVGDVVLLEQGDEIPADGRILQATELRVDQSLMTGESEPVAKLATREQDDRSDGPEQAGCVYRGTQVVEGVGRMLVTEVGDDTYLGKLARNLGNGHVDDGAEAGRSGGNDRLQRKLTISKDLTPLQRKLLNLAKLISRVGYLAALLIFLAQFGQGVYTGDVHWPVDWDDALGVFGNLLGYFVTMVIIIVVAVPEGLPMSVTVSLALAMRKMTRSNCLVRRLVACETIGSATVICSDKTGTLTQNKMQVVRLAWDESVVEIAAQSPDGSRATAANVDEPKTPIDWIAVNAAVNSTAYLTTGPQDNAPITMGNSTEGSLLFWLREDGIDHERLREKRPALYRIPFSSERKHMATVIAGEAGPVVLVKGAPEAILSQSTRYFDEDGQAQAMTAVKREAIDGLLQDASRQAMRTLAFAQRVLPAGMATDEESLQRQQATLDNDMVYVGFVAIRDPLRPEVKQAVDDCRRASINIKMVTGDNVQTARAIAHDVGLIDDADAAIDTRGAAIITSDRLNELDDEALKAELGGIRVVARARPLDKYRLVQCLQDTGEVVAVTGDGTNDAPALKKADVGLSMGIAGTEVSKEASEMVLLDDSFATIVRGVLWGRSLYENIQRFLQFQLTINLSALTIMLLGILIFQVKAPFTVLQLLWINVIMDTFASIALCSEPPRRGLMKEKPRQRDENILTPAMVKNILSTAAFFVVVMLALLVFMRGTPDDPGMLAGSGPWLVEVSGGRQLAMAEDLNRSETGVYTFEGQRAEVDYTMQQATLFFTIFVFFQVWNLINCRSLTARESALKGIHRNIIFLGIVALIVLGQVAIVTFGGDVFKTAPLSVAHWLAVAVFTSSVLVAAEVVRILRRLLTGKDR